MQAKTKNNPCKQNLIWNIIINKKHFYRKRNWRDLVNIQMAMININKIKNNSNLIKIFQWLILVPIKRYSQKMKLRIMISIEIWCLNYSSKAFLEGNCRQRLEVLMNLVAGEQQAGVIIIKIITRAEGPQFIFWIIIIIIYSIKIIIKWWTKKIKKS